MSSALPFHLNALLALGLLIALGLSGLGLGLRLLRLFEGEALPLADRGLVALPLGLGFAAQGVLGLGLVGLLRPGWVTAWLAVLVAAGAPAGWRFVRLVWWEGRSGCKPRRVRPLHPFVLIGGLLGIIWLLALLVALTPPWDYDGLMYHLEGPRRFLTAGRLLLLPELWQANGPSNGEMLFLFGLSLGSDIFAKLLHGLFGCLFLALAWRIGRRFGPPLSNWLMVAILSSMPILPFLAGWAYIDLMWFTWEGLAFYLLLVWWQNQCRPSAWLTLSGLMMGLALGSKAQALAALPVAGALLCLMEGKDGLRRLLRDGVRFGLPALLLAAPWYLKNALLGNNPFYPLFWGGTGYPRERWDLLATYLYNFGNGRSLKDFLLLPWALYAQRERFATFMGSADMPSLLFPLALLFPLRSQPGKQDMLILWLILGRALVWALGSQQIRFLYPVFLWLSLLAARGLLTLTAYLGRRFGRVLVLGLVGGSLVATLTLQSMTMAVWLRPWLVWLGSESPQVWLAHPWPDYPLQDIILQRLPAEARVLFLWEGRGYYCAERCLPDADHTRAVLLAEAAGWQPQRLAALLHAQGFSYLLLDRASALFTIYHDPSGRHARALDFWEQVFLPHCAIPIAEGEWSRLYRLTCTP